MKRKHKVWGAFLALVLVVSFTIASCTTKEEKVKPEVIRLAMIADMSGPYAPIVGPAYVSFKDACQYVNEDLGGIKGVKIEPVCRDSGGKVDVALSHYMEIREMEPRPLMMSSTVSGEAEAMHQRLIEDQIPALVVASDAALYPQGYSFGWYVAYTDQFGFFVDWLAKNWKKSTRPKVAVLTWDSTYGRAILTDEAMAYAKKKVDIVATEVFGLRDMDVSTQLVRIRDKKADWIYTNTAGHGPVVIAKGIRELGYKVNLAGGLGLDESCIYVGGKIMEGVYSVYPYTSWSEEEVEGVKLMSKYYKMNRRKETDKTLMGYLSWVYVLMARQVIGEIVDEAGWGGVNGPAIKAKIENLKDFRAKGLCYFSYTPKKRTPTKARIVQIKGGKMVSVTGWSDAPDLLPTKYR